MLDRNGLPNHPAHRHADIMCLFKVKVIHQAHHIAGQLRQGIWTIAASRFAVPTGVETDRPKAFAGRQRRIPEPLIGTEAMPHQNRRCIAWAIVHICDFDIAKRGQI